MKQIKLKENHIELNDPNCLQNYLLNIGVKPEDIEFFLSPDTEMQSPDNEFGLSDIGKALKLVFAAANSNKKFFVQVDSDADGFTSSAIFYNYFHQRYPNLEIRYRLHEGKQHGIIPDTIPNDTNIVIIPDAGSMQQEEQREVLSRGMQIVILDHHDVTEVIEDENLAVVNNQRNDFKNPNLSGAGVTWLFIKAYDETYFLPSQAIYQNFMDLAALGIISDVMDCRPAGNQFLVHNGLHHIINPIFKELLKRQSFKIKKPQYPTKIDVAFYITPIINGLIRSGSQEEKELFFRAMVDPYNNEIFKSEYRGVQRSETLAEYAVRLAANAKSRQDAAKKKYFEYLKNLVETKHKDEPVIIITLTEKESNDINPNITGLIAMEICNYYNRPTLVCRYLKEEDGIHYAGSGRSNNYVEFPSLMGFLRESGLVDYAEGHANAFGVSISEKNVPLLQQYCRDKLANINFDDDYIEVDYIFYNLVNPQVLLNFADHRELYGNRIPEPVFAFKLVVDADDVFVMGADKSSLKITKNKVEFVAFKNPSYIKQLQQNGLSDVTIVGSPVVNEWNGNRSAQIVCNEMIITKKQESVLGALI